MSQPSPASPLVSIGVPVYNAERYLPETLDSLRAQNHENLEIIISDNASTDSTPDICRAAAREDERVHYIPQDRNRGGAWNCNAVLAQARGEFVKLASSDDVIRPGFVSAALAALQAGGEDHVLAIPRTQIIDADGAVIEDLNDTNLALVEPTPHERITHLLRAEASHLIYSLMRTDVLRTTRGIQYVTGCDIVLMMEMACRGTFAIAPEQLFLERRHAEQASGQGAGHHVKWYDPDATVRFAFPETKLAAQCYRAITSSPIPTKEKARCISAVTTNWVLPRRRGYAGDLKLLVLGR